MPNQPRGREQNVTGQGKGAYRRGEGLGTGPVGNGGGYNGRGQNHGGSGGGGKRAGGGMNPLMLIIALAVMALGGGGMGLSGMLGGDSAPAPAPGSSYSQPAQPGSSTSGSYQNQGGQSTASNTSLGNMLGGFTSANVSSGWNGGSNIGNLDTSVAAGSRAKRTKIRGNGKDTVTIMVYMCGADLESRSGMATADLQEMASANLTDDVNIIVYTGGARQWKNNIVSNSTTQIYKVVQGGLKKLETNMGDKAMTTPSTLTSFIKYCKKNFPADRNELIFWDHGGGSLSGYGYDEKFAQAGSMTLKGINEALSSAGMTFDFIGFDACLMATVENALMLTKYADYLIASEETEPGVGWYYTDWLNKLCRNTSMPTIEIGKNIIDDFVKVCAQKCNGQKTTLSIIDLAEVENTIPAELASFSNSTIQLIEDNNFQVVSNARSNAREFATSTKIDQVDLVSLAKGIGTEEAKSLANALMSAVKYNKTSTNMTNAYGLSIYFPYKKTSQVKNAGVLYDAIGMDDSYSECIRKFASMEVSGQAISGGASSPMSTLMGGNYSSGGSVATSDEMIIQILSGLLGGQLSNVSGLTADNSSFLGRSLDVDSTAAFLEANRFDPELLLWTPSNDNVPAIYLPESQWELVQDLELNLFLDDGEGYIDMGLDNVYSFTSDDGLSGKFNGTWIAINDQEVPYYHTDTVDEGDTYTITGRVPALLNGERVNLILVFTDEQPKGYVAGADPVYAEDETQTVSKSLVEIVDGDTIDFICDYYTYDGEYQDSYFMGDQIIVDGGLTISDVYVDAEAANACYRFTDIYQQEYWTPIMQ